MLDPLNHVEQCYRDTFIRSVEGFEQISNLSRIFGLNYPQGFPEDSWRRALRAAGYGRRGTISQIFDFLSGLLHHYTRDILVQCTQITPTVRLTSSTGEFKTDDHSRFIRLLTSPDAATPARPYAADHTGPIHFSIAYGGTAGVSNFVDLANVQTTYWSRPDLTVSTRYYARVYPFTMAEPTPGRTQPDSNANSSSYLIGYSQAELAAKLIIKVLGSVADVPPTYMVPAGGGARADSNEPVGGHLQPSELTEARMSDPNHPYPPYIPGSTLGSTASESLDLLLAAGVSAIESAY